MRWSIRVLRVGETEVRLHATLALLLAWYAWTGWRGAGFSGAVAASLFIVFLFVSVLLHEFGHILAARRYGIPTPEIILSPIGGIARIARMPQKPSQELVVALAGPLVTLFILVAGLLIWIATGSSFNAFLMAADHGSLWPMVILTNGFLLAFNLLPAFPMDGGRVVRALIAARWGFLRGTQVAARLGQLLAVGFVILGLWGNPILLLIGLFVLTAAEGELQMARRQAALRQMQAQGIDITNYHPHDRFPPSPPGSLGG
jgi:Zn-dependent protease